MKKIISVVTSLIVFFTVILSPGFTMATTAAGEGLTYLDLNHDGSLEKIQFTNDELIIMTDKGETLFNKSFAKADSRINVSFSHIKDNYTFSIVVQAKSRDTSSLLSYYIYDLNNNIISLTFSNEDIYKGLLEIKDNYLLEKTPIYDKDESNSSPSHFGQTVYKLTENKIEKASYEILPYFPVTQNNNNPNNLKTDAYYKNPSYEQINNMLQTIALEKGIPPVLLKAIAWQESKGTDKDNGGVVNWRQFKDGAPLISYDGKGIGIMQISDYDPTDPAQAAYIERVKYDIEFNIREGVECLLTKWSLSFLSASSIYRIPKIGSMEPTYLEHWYFAIWAYNGYSQRNNPVDNYAVAYQTLIINHVNIKFGTPMKDLYKDYPSISSDPSYFASGVLPRKDIPSGIDGKNYGGLKKKSSGVSYIVTSDTPLKIRDGNNNLLGSFNKNEIVTVSGEPKITDGYIRYYASASGKEGWVACNWLQPLGDNNMDRLIDIFDLTGISRFITTKIDATNNIYYDKYDVNNDNSIDIVDISTAAKNYNKSLYTDEVK